MLPKSFTLLTLIVATQFSQGFAAPRDDIMPTVDLGSMNAGSILQPPKELLPPEQQISPAGQNVVDLKTSDISAQPTKDRVNENVDNLIQTTNAQLENVATPMPSEAITQLENPEEHLSHMLTREQELKILHQVPEFTEIIRAMEQLPDGIYEELKSFLESTVPRMPEGNLFTQHFRNSAVLIHMFERLIKVARTGGVFKPSSKALFEKVHRAAPAMKREMNEFNGFIANAQERLPSLGTSTNPMSQMALPQTAGANVAAGSVSLPVAQQTESFTSESAPSQ